MTNTTSSFALSDQHVGQVIKYRERATNLLTSDFREAEDQTGVIAPAPPTNTADPSFNGQARDGQLLDGNRGTWTGTPTITYAFQWLRCPSSCSPIPGATSENYVLTPADVGKRVRLQVTTTGPGGQATDSSPLSPVVAAAPPRNVQAPKIAGTARQGQVLTGSQGFWAGTAPITFTYGWYRCSATCVKVGSGQSHRLTSRDVGQRTVLAVTGSNGGGSSTAFATTGTVRDAGSGSTPSPGGTSGGLRALRPFPIVAIGGRVLGSGVVLTELQIRRAPKGSRITITCRGGGCPFKRARYRMRRSSLRIRPLQRRLGGGAVITIFIRKGNTIGKYTRIRIRRGQAPARLDRCVRPGSSKPRRCP